MPQNLNLNWLRSFEATARLLSFTKAAQELGLTQTAVSQHIKALETKLGQRLFLRRPRSLQITDIGNAYLTSVRESLRAIEMSTSGLFGPDLESTVVLRGSIAFLTWLSPSLGSFQEQHPEIGIKLVTSIWDGQETSEQVDLDVLLASNTHAPAGLEKLSEEHIVPICAGSGVYDDLTAQEIAGLKPIHILGFDDHWARYLSAFGISHDATSTRLMADTSVVAMEMVAADLGSAVIIERFAAKAVETGRPLQIAGPPVALEQSHYLRVSASGPKPNPAVEALANWLRQRFATQ